jgi:hypothetical protein
MFHKDFNRKGTVAKKREISGRESRGLGAKTN